MLNRKVKYTTLSAVVYAVIISALINLTGCAGSANHPIMSEYEAREAVEKVALSSKAIS